MRGSGNSFHKKQLGQGAQALGLLTWTSSACAILVNFSSKACIISCWGTPTGKGSALAIVSAFHGGVVTRYVRCHMFSSKTFERFSLGKQVPGRTIKQQNTIACTHGHLLMETGLTAHRVVTSRLGCNQIWDRNGTKKD